ncbi:MAG: zf-HC2 domain-containing protein [Clostridiales bacterium]|nr:zf-HC2 domain-containing protein [Clostridiales bacterium]
MTCREAEKMVMPFINHSLSEHELEQFLKHITSCPDCKEELEIYYTVYLGLRQLDFESDEYDISGSLERNLEDAWIQVKANWLRQIIRYAVGTLSTVGIVTLFLMQLRIWLQGGWI